MDCYAGSASRAAAAKCEACSIGELCPVGTSLDVLGREVFETAGTLQLDGIQAEMFESSKADIIAAIQRHFYEQGDFRLQTPINLDTLDAAAVSQLFLDAVRSDSVAAALNTSWQFLLAPTGALYVVMHH